MRTHARTHAHTHNKNHLPRSLRSRTCLRIPAAAPTQTTTQTTTQTATFTATARYARGPAYGFRQQHQLKLQHKLQPLPPPQHYYRAAPCSAKASCPAPLRSAGQHTFAELLVVFGSFGIEAKAAKVVCRLRTPLPSHLASMASRGTTAEHAQLLPPTSPCLPPPTTLITTEPLFYR